MIALSHIIEAYERISPIVNNTHLAYAPRMSDICGANVFLKQENLQHTGSYKLRGAFNRIALMSKQEREKGVIAASAGNHAQGVAYSAKHFGIKGVIVMPETTPLMKIGGVKRLGAEIILHGSNYDEAYSHALQYAKDHDLFFVHPFADDQVIAGQATVGLEIVREKTDIDTVILPVGGGGLISGVSALYRHMKPNTRIIGVSAQGAPAMYQSFKNKQIHKCKNVHTIADGIAVRDVHPTTFEYILECVDDMVMVDDEEVANAILFLLENQKVIAEGAGAVGVAALLHQKIHLKKGENVAVVLSGGNIDVTMLGVIIEKGLLKSQRKMKFSVVLLDKPGSLKQLIDILTQTKANIIAINHDRTSTALDYGDANLTVTIETRGQEHKEQIKKELKAHHFNVTEIA